MNFREVSLGVYEIHDISVELHFRELFGELFDIWLEGKADDCQMLAAEYFLKFIVELLRITKIVKVNQENIV